MALIGKARGRRLPCAAEAIPAVAAVGMTLTPAGGISFLSHGVILRLEKYKPGETELFSKELYPLH